MTKTYMLNVNKIRQDFPILKRKINGHPLIYLDNAATSQKPQQVIDALVNYYSNHNANIHRGIHTLAEEATSLYEEAREKVAKFINADSSKEIIFVRNSTEAINLVAYSWGRSFLKKSDEVILTEAEHHSNLIPWQILAAEKGIVLKFLKVDSQGLLSLNHFKKLLSEKTKLIALTHVSNVLGLINPVEQITKLGHQNKSLVLIDGSQSIPHFSIDVQKIDCDFFAFTGHKMLGPTGIGVLWGKEKILQEMPPFLGGGSMIRDVYLSHFTTNDLPHKFEAGTPNIAGAIGLGAAIDYLQKLGMENIFQHEKELTDYALGRLSNLDNLELYGPKNSEKKTGIVSFNLKSVPAHDLAQILDGEGIAIRSGFHCAMPLHESLGISATARASFYLYNTKEEINKLIEGIKKARKIFKI